MEYTQIEKVFLVADALRMASTQIPNTHVYNNIIITLKARPMSHDSDSKFSLAYLYLIQKKLNLVFIFDTSWWLNIYCRYGGPCPKLHHEID